MDIIWEVFLHRHMHAWWYYYNLRSVCIVLLFITYYPCGSIAWPISEGHSLAKSAHSFFFNPTPINAIYFSSTQNVATFYYILIGIWWRFFCFQKVGNLMRLVTTAKFPLSFVQKECWQRALTKWTTLFDSLLQHSHEEQCCWQQIVM